LSKEVRKKGSGLTTTLQVNHPLPLLE